MTSRLEYWQAAPDIPKLIGSVNKYLKYSTLTPLLRHIVLLRISQINGCAYCVDLHYAEALQDGDNAQRLNCVAVWQETPYFSEEERAALKWAEVLTNIAGNGVSDAAYAAVSARFSERELADLTFLISSMNAWNRLSIAFGRQPNRKLKG